MSGPDEKWYRGDTGAPYWRPSTVGDDRWIVIHGAVDAPERPQDAPGRIEAAPAVIDATPDPTPLPVTRAGRIRALMGQVRSGDKSAVDALREALMGE